MLNNFSIPDWCFCIAIFSVPSEAEKSDRSFIYPTPKRILRSYSTCHREMGWCARGLYISCIVFRLLACLLFSTRHGVVWVECCIYGRRIVGGCRGKCTFGNSG